MTVEELTAENRRRMERMYTGFDPLTGKGAPVERVPLRIPDFTIPEQWVPAAVAENPLVREIVRHGSIGAFVEERLKTECTPQAREKVVRDLCIVRSRHDFCFWAYAFVRIKPKSGGGMIPFRLRYEQRLLLAEMEAMRLAGKPIRIILLKARQWGGSTLVQIYMAWIQLVHKSGWYSTIVAQTKDVSRKIKAMYAKLLEGYPSWLLDIPDRQLAFSPYENSASDFVITYGAGTGKTVARDTVVTIGTYENPDATRGGDTALIHYSEVALWAETPGKKPEDVIRSVSGGLLELPLTMEVLESTANGTGNYFHREWERAKRGESNRRPVFIPWYCIEHDSLSVEDEAAFARWLLENRENEGCPTGWLDAGKYYWYLWEQGATFAGINWYRTKRKAFADHADMASEAPSDDVEAFKHSGRRVFDIYRIGELRRATRPPRFVGEVHGAAPTGKETLRELHFVGDGKGLLQVWELPEADPGVSNRYLAVVDVGGRSALSDYSVIAVFDRFPMSLGGKPEIVAQWRGHLDSDLLAWKAARIAAFYHRALLVIESNTLETRDRDRDTEGDHTEYILSRIADVYDNLYARTGSEADIREGAPRRWGFHTNTATKPLVIDHLIACVRDGAWVERDAVCCDELGYYERKENGAYGAVTGQHDDVLMTRAIGLYICHCQMPLPRPLVRGRSALHRSDAPISEATF